jgi:hypothetical protein
MVGQGVLRECLVDPQVTEVISIGRSALATQHAKLRSFVKPDLFHFDPTEPAFNSIDACFFCLGVTSVGKNEEEYTRITYTLTMAAAEPLSARNPAMTFIYVSGQGTGRDLMWARVKSRTENEIIRLFKNGYAFRPGIILPVNGEKSRVAAANWFYTFTSPLYGILQRAFPRQVITTEELGRAMLHVARNGAPKHVLEQPDIGMLGRIAK